MSVYTLILETLILEVTPRVHLDNKSREGDTCKLLLSKDNIDMKAKTLNEIKGDEVIKKLHNLLTKSRDNMFIICIKLRWKSSTSNVCTTAINCKCTFMRQKLRQIKRSKRDPTISRSCFKFGDYVYKDITYTNRFALYIDLNIAIDSDRRIRTKLYDERNEFNW